MSDLPAWLSRSSPARFRGVVFLSDSHDAKGGRRLAVHDLPGADVPVVEDLGAASGGWKVNAYFVGADYDLARDKFLGVLNTPGAEWLMHPWLGRLWVRPQAWSVHESTDKGGFCTVSVDFVPGGGEIPTPEPDVADTASSNVGKMMSASQKAFALAKLSSTSMNKFLAVVSGRLDNLRNMLALAQLPLTLAQEVQQTISGIKGDLAELMAMPGRYAVALGDLFVMLGSSADKLALAAGLSSVLDLPASDGQLGLVRMLSGVSGDALGGDFGGVLSGVSDSLALRQALAAESVLRSELALGSAAELSLVDYAAAEDRDAALASVTSGIDALLPSMPDAVFQAALTARTSVIEALSAQDLLPAVSREIYRPTPAVVLAYQLGSDASVFARRNAFIHPLFVSGVVHG